MVGHKDEKQTQNFVLNKSHIIVDQSDNKQTNKRIWNVTNATKKKEWGCI